MTYHSLFGLDLVAFLVTACVALASSFGAGSSAVAALPFACALVARQHGGSVVLEGQLAARAAVAGSYAFSVHSAGVTIDQAGGLAVAAGETARLGEAMISGRAADHDTSLTVTVGGQAYVCPLQET